MQQIHEEQNLGNPPLSSLSRTHTQCFQSSKKKKKKETVNKTTAGVCVWRRWVVDERDETQIQYKNKETAWREEDRGEREVDRERGSERRGEKGRVPSAGSRTLPAEDAHARTQKKNSRTPSHTHHTQRRKKRQRRNVIHRRAFRRAVNPNRRRAVADERRKKKRRQIRRLLGH